MNFLKKSMNIETIECMEYICHKIIFFAKFQNLHIYFKSSVVDGIFVWIFFLMVNYIDTYQLQF